MPGLLLVALCVVLRMTPAAYHRIVYAGEDAQDVHRAGSALVTAATVPLSLGLARDVYVVITRIAESSAAGLAATSLTLVLLIGLWYVYPLIAVLIRTTATTGGFARGESRISSHTGDGSEHRPATLKCRRPLSSG